MRRMFCGRLAVDALLDELFALFSPRVFLLAGIKPLVDKSYHPRIEELCGKVRSKGSSGTDGLTISDDQQTTTVTDRTTNKMSEASRPTTPTADTSLRSGSDLGNSPTSVRSASGSPAESNASSPLAGGVGGGGRGGGGGGGRNTPVGGGKNMERNLGLRRVCCFWNSTLLSIVLPMDFLWSVGSSVSFAMFRIWLFWFCATWVPVFLSAQCLYAHMNLSAALCLGVGAPSMITIENPNAIYRPNVHVTRQAHPER